jgi:AcrR family transcriptional regulator
MAIVSPVTGAAPPASPAATGAAVPAVIVAMTASYEAADASRRRLVEAAERCIVRWGIRKTSLDDIAREAGVSRATVYRAFPGGKDRVLAEVGAHAVGRFFHALSPELSAAETLEDLLVVAVGALLREGADNPVLPSMVEHEPDLVLPHVTFHRMAGLFDLADAVSRPHLERFLPPDEVRPAAELLTRCVLTFAFRPAGWLDPHDRSSVRRFVRTYLTPAIGGPGPAAAPRPDPTTAPTTARTTATAHHRPKITTVREHPS